MMPKFLRSKLQSSKGSDYHDQHFIDIRLYHRNIFLVHNNLRSSCLFLHTVLSSVYDESGNLYVCTPAADLW